MEGVRWGLTALQVAAGLGCLATLLACCRRLTRSGWWGCECLLGPAGCALLGGSGPGVLDINFDIDLFPS